MTPLHPATMVVLAKEPVPGQVKTRLCPPYSLQQAADLARAALTDTIDTVSALPGARPVCALQGAPGSWLPAGWTVVAQRHGDLGDRIAGALDDAYAAHGGPVLLVGMDTPQLTVSLLQQAVDALVGHDAVLGPAADGGWWLIGLHRPDATLVTGIPTSRDDTGARQRERLRSRGLRVADLPVLRDVDTAADATTAAALAPGSRFAAELGRIGAAA